MPSEIYIYIHIQIFEIYTYTYIYIYIYIYISKICWQNPAKAKTTVHILLKVLTDDYLVYISEHISKTAILTEASVFTSK